MTRPVVVWDLPTRIFHGLLIAIVLTGWATAESEGALFAIHRYNGYVLMAALVFRVVWGFAGSPHSRFADFVRPWAEVRAHAMALLRLRPPPAIGHNPLGGWMVLALLGTLALLAATGLFAAGEHGAAGGPFATALPRWLSRGAAGLHEGLFGVLIGLVALHAAGVLLESLLTGDNLMRAMITGRKWLSAAEARREAAPVAPLWALLVVAVSGAAVWLALV